ncbi:zinc finger protein, partial [Cystoisospora suis]
MASSLSSSSLTSSSPPHLHFQDASLSMVLNGLTAGENLQEGSRKALGELGGALGDLGHDEDDSSFFFNFFLADPRISPGLHNTLCLLVATCLFLWSVHLLRRLVYANKLYKHFLIQQHPLHLRGLGCYADELQCLFRIHFEKIVQSLKPSAPIVILRVTVPVQTKAVSLLSFSSSSPLLGQDVDRDRSEKEKEKKGGRRDEEEAQGEKKRSASVRDEGERRERDEHIRGEESNERKLRRDRKASGMGAGRGDEEEEEDQEREQETEEEEVVEILIDALEESIVYVYWDVSIDALQKA